MNTLCTIHPPNLPPTRLPTLANPHHGLPTKFRTANSSSPSPASSVASSANAAYYAESEEYKEAEAGKAELVLAKTATVKSFT